MTEVKEIKNYPQGLWFSAGEDYVPCDKNDCRYSRRGYFAPACHVCEHFSKGNFYITNEEWNNLQQ